MGSVALLEMINFTIINCNFTNNVVHFGGALYINEGQQIFYLVNEFL